MLLRPNKKCMCKVQVPPKCTCSCKVLANLETKGKSYTSNREFCVKDSSHEFRSTPNRSGAIGLLI